MAAELERETETRAVEVTLQQGRWNSNGCFALQRKLHTNYWCLSHNIILVRWTKSGIFLKFFALFLLHFCFNSQHATQDLIIRVITSMKRRRCADSSSDPGRIGSLTSSTSPETGNGWTSEEEETVIGDLPQRSLATHRAEQCQNGYNRGQPAASSQRAAPKLATIGHTQQQ